MLSCWISFLWPVSEQVYTLTTLILCDNCTFCLQVLVCICCSHCSPKIKNFIS